MRKRLTIHIFNNYGQYEGFVLRADLSNKPTITVRVSNKLREAVRVTGRGWCIFLPEKARIPSDIHAAQ